MSGVRVATMDDPLGTAGTAPTTPLDALQVMASSDVMLTPTLRHIEMYTMRGLLTLLWHEPPEDAPTQPGALVLCGGAMGGLLGRATRSTTDSASSGRPAACRCCG